jgi:sugar phosphate isomerase/epimerase
MKHTVTLFAAAALAALALVGCKTGPTGSAPVAGGTPKVGLQAYTFRNLSFAETLDRAQAFGVEHLQAYPGQKLAPDGGGTFHHTMDAATQAHVLNLARSKGITLVSYGVVNGKDEAEWQQIFAFAKAMGLQGITTEPPQAVLPLVARLARENGIRVSLHNHPTPSIYANPETALSASRPHAEWIGLSADTGHWARSGYDPVATLRLAQGRLFELHFKDLTEIGVKGAHDMPWGTGASNAAGQIAELRRQGFSGIAYVEYEHMTPSLDRDVERSVAYFKKAATAPMEDLLADRVLPPEFTATISDTWSERQTGYGARGWPEPKPLFDAQLSQAVSKGAGWNVQQGTLVPKGETELWTPGNHADFALSMEFLCQQGSEGKVLLRAPNGENGLAVQILQGDAQDDKHLVGAIHGVVGPTRQITITPGEWNRFVILAKGQELTVLLNGEAVTKLNVKDPRAQATGDNATPPPLEVPVPAEGRIGLKSGARPVQFRNVRIEPL